MSDFWRDWLHNIWVTLAAFIGVCVFFYIFLLIFYRDSLPLTFEIVKGTALLITGINLWPIVVLAIIVGLLTSTMPRRSRRSYRSR